MPALISFALHLSHLILIGWISPAAPVISLTKMLVFLFLRSAVKPVFVVTKRVMVLVDTDEASDELDTKRTLVCSDLECVHLSKLTHPPAATQDYNSRQGTIVLIRYYWANRHPNHTVTIHNMFLGTNQDENANSDKPHFELIKSFVQNVGNAPRIQNCQLRCSSNNPSNFQHLLWEKFRMLVQSIYCQLKAIICFFLNVGGCFVIYIKGVAKKLLVFLIL